MKKIIRIKEISDFTLAFLILGLAEAIFGTTMFGAGLYSFCKEKVLADIMIDAMLHGSALSLNGIVLMALCLMSVVFAIRKKRVNVLWELSIVSVFIAFIGMIRAIVCASNGFSILFSVMELVICGIVFFILTTTKRFLERRAHSENYSWSGDMLLKKVG